ncbi:MAG: aspartate aminotransferase family protein [Anaerolineales bacterium]|nr:aspartate aminotransferase family protein [Anaerolineales bacterium]
MIDTQIDYLTQEALRTSGVYGKRDQVIIRGKGAYLWDDRGRRYIDLTAGIGVANLGHAHPRLVAAITQQASTLITCPELFYNDRRAELLGSLAGVLPEGLERVFLCNSGTEAVEAALKFARLSTGRTDVVAAMRGFHGRTFGALSATHKNAYREPFLPLVPGFTHVPFNNFERLAAALTQNTAAVILEVVQGEGGVRPGSREYFQAVRQICEQRNILLILDEVQTGFGRTGRWFAFEHMGIVPDILALGKGIAGGVPMGATVLGPRVRELPVGVHGSTFGGNPLAAAAAIASIEIYKSERLVEQAAEQGAWFLDRLSRIESPHIREVRGLGLMVGVELRSRVFPVVEALTELGVLALIAGPTVLRLLPPLVIDRSDLAAAADLLEQALTVLDGEENTDG